MQPSSKTFGGERRSSGLLSVPDAAEYLGLSTGTVRNWLSMKRLDYVKVGRLTRVSVAALDRFIAANTVRAKNDVSL